MSFLSYISRFLSFLKFKYVSSFISLIVVSVLFWRYSPDIAFNDIYVFANTSSRMIALGIFWFIIFIFFALRPMIRFFASLKDDKKEQMKEIKKPKCYLLKFIMIKDKLN